MTCNVEKLVKTNDFCKFDTILHDRGCAFDNMEFLKILNKLSFSASPTPFCIIGVALLQNILQKSLGDTLRRERVAHYTCGLVTFGLPGHFWGGGL